MTMNHPLRTAFIVLVLLVAASSVFAGGQYRRIDGAELERMMSDGEPIVIVDVREPWLFERGRIPGSINIPYDDARERITKELDPADRIVFVCHGGPMGDELGALLAGMGYDRVYNLKGGMYRWRGPTER